MPDDVKVNRVHLRTANLSRAVAFYQQAIGLRVINQTETEAALSATGFLPALLVLTEDRNAVPSQELTTGLYHLAIRYPARRDLAHSLLRLAAVHHRITGASDHVLGESIHLHDPDGNGVELYFDQPRSRWPMRDGMLEMITKPLDLDGLLALAHGDALPEYVPAHTDIGHINLHVAELDRAEEFYHDLLGFKVTARIGTSATFLAAGDYHHHIAVNTWAGKTPAPSNSVGLISFRLQVADAGTLVRLGERACLSGHEVRMNGQVLQISDPDGHRLEVEVGQHASTPGGEPLHTTVTGGMA